MPQTTTDKSLVEALQPPHWLHTATELPRSMRELSMLLSRNSTIKRLGRGRANASDNVAQTVMVLPGFSAGDRSTAILRRYLDHWGYNARPWDMGNNMNPREIDSFGDVAAYLQRYVEQLSISVRQLHDKNGPVSLIGWSMGGIISRVLASEHPELVRQVITLGTPFGDPRGTAVYALFDRLRKQSMNESEVAHWLSLCDAPLGDTPLSILYSARDGVVSTDIATREACRKNRRLESIHVDSSHLGFTCNPMALYIIADRLAQCDKNWRPYRHRKAIHDLLT